MKPARYGAGERLSRHGHRTAYAALVLDGGYIEAGDRGRIVATAGQVLFHGAFEAHQDIFTSNGAVVIDLPLNRPDLTCAAIPDPDAIARLAETDCEAACDLLYATAVEIPEIEGDWPDRLARGIIEDPNLKLAEWADRAGLAPQSVSRGFRQVFGISPKKFRAVQRTLRTVDALPGWKDTGAALAAELGFADQAHMTRSVSALTGWCPSRFGEKWVQAGGFGRR